MIEIIRATTEDKKLLFRMMGGNVRKMQEYEGQVLSPEAWVLYEDISESDAATGESDAATGETSSKTVLSVLVDGESIGTISPTFISTFLDMIDFLGDDVKFTVSTGISKGGRKFIFPDPV